MKSNLYGENQVVIRLDVSDIMNGDLFVLKLPVHSYNYNLNEIFEMVFSGTDANRVEMISRLDLELNPDFEEMYWLLVDIVRFWRLGILELRFFLGNGSEIGTEKVVAECLPLICEQVPSESPILDIVLQHRFRTLDYSLDCGYLEDKRSTLQWLLEHTILYFTVKEKCCLNLQEIGESEPKVALVISRLEREGWIIFNDDNRGLFPTHEGSEKIAELLIEAESYANQYNIFRDVLYSKDLSSVEFESGHGKDLRADVFEAEGLDPIRVGFLLLLYEGAFEDFIGGCFELLIDERMFEELLVYAVATNSINRKTIGAIMDCGLTYAEEQAEKLERLAKHRQVVDHIRGNV